MWKWPRHGSWWRAAALVAALAVGAAVRLQPWPWVFGGSEVRLTGDGDPVYHLLQAERLSSEPLRATWRDPGLDWPLGADVPWPPLFDVALALAGRVAALGATPNRSSLLVGGALLPVLLGLIAIWLAARIGRTLFGGRDWLDAALILALLPSHAIFTVLGRPDQHAAEPLVAGLVIIATARIAAGAGRGPALLLAMAVNLGFWTWSGSALFLALVAGFPAAWHVTAAPGDPAPGRAAAWLAAGLAGGAALLGATLAAVGPPGALAEARVTGLTGLQPALAAGAAAACGLLAVHRARRPDAGAIERTSAAVAALIGPVAALWLVPWSRAGFTRGVNMLAAAGWYRTIVEFQPLLLGGLVPLREDVKNLLCYHGLAILAVPAALPLLWRRWRGAAQPHRGPLLLALVILPGTLLLALARNRFILYLSVAEALSLALIARALSGAVARRWPARRWAGPASGVALAGALLSPALLRLPEAPWVTRPLSRYSDLEPLLRFAAHFPTPPGREALFAPWNFGHDVRWFSGRPVVSSPFGVEGGEGALEDDAAFHFATDPDAAEALLARRRVGLVLVSAPLDEVVSLIDLAPPGGPSLVRLSRSPLLGIDARVEPAWVMLVVARLHLFDGMWGDLDGRVLSVGPAALGGFRLVAESPTIDLWLSAVPVRLCKLFQPVAGVIAHVRGVSPGRRVEARVPLVTNTGRSIEFVAHGYAGADGVTSLRLPYAFGANGLVQAGPWSVTDGARTAMLMIGEAEVVLGGAREVALGPAR